MIQEKLSEVKKLIVEDQLNQAENLMGDIMPQAQNQFGDLAYEMAEFYYLYGSILVQKIQTQADFLGEKMQEAQNNLNPDNEEDEKEQEENQEGLVQQENENDQELNRNESRMIQNEEQKEEEKQEQELKGGDFQLAWENLESAKVILKRELDNAKEEDKQSIMKNLAKAYLKMAELESWQDNFEGSVKEHQACLNLRLQIENPELSRDLAESYFLLGNVELYQFKDGCEETAMKYYIKALQILENNLSKQLGTSQKDVLQIITMSEIIQTVHLNESFMDSKEVKELKSVIKLLYEKIEDIKQQLKEKNTEEYKEFERQLKIAKQKEKEKQMEKEKENEQQKFDQPQLQDKPIIKLGQFGNAAIRRNNENKKEDEKDESSLNKDLKLN